MPCASLSWHGACASSAPWTKRRASFRCPRASTSAPDAELSSVYPPGDWRNAALDASLSDEGRIHREARGRNVTYMANVTYDGEAYLGFQYQPKDATVQGEIEKALSRLLGEDRDFLGVGASGRTDTGVHAKGQVVHFYTRSPLPDLERARKSLNGMLPKDIRVVELSRPHPAFHARFHAVRKTYHYYLDTRLEYDVFTRRHALHVGWKPPDMERLKLAAAELVGTHDFSAFSNKSRDAPEKARDPVRTIYRFDVVELPDGLVRLEVEGNGFLYRMVRHMVGAVMLAATKRDAGPEDVQKMLQGKDRRGAPMGAPPHGLFLHQVVYPTALTEWYPPEGYDDRLLEVSVEGETQVESNSDSNV